MTKVVKPHLDIFLGMLFSDLLVSILSFPTNFPLGDKWVSYQSIQNGLHTHSCHKHPPIIKQSDLYACNPFHPTSLSLSQ